jgi:hypothetical protein
MLANLPLSSTAVLLIAMSFICAYGTIRIRRRAAANPQNELLHYFGYFFLGLTCFSVTFVIPFLFFRHNTVIPVWGYIFAQFFFGTATSFLGAFVARSFNKRAIFGFLPIMLITIAEFAVHVTHFPNYDVASLDTYNIQKITPFVVAAALIGLKAITPIIPLGVIMIRQAIKIPAARTRSLMIFAGLVLMLVGGPLHDVGDPRLFAIADLVTLFGVVTILGGLLVEPVSQPQPSRS